jgi:hypothetical protein
MLQAAPSDTYVAVLQEEFGMTFQVALINQNGVVLGSDRVHLYVGLEKLSRFRRAVQRQTECKILFSDDKQLVCCYAGGAGSQRIAREIRRSCNPSGLSNSAWEDQIQHVTADVTASGPGIQDEIIIVRLDNQSGVLMAREYTYGPGFTSINNCCFAGDYSDARFLGHHLMRDDMSLHDMQNLSLLCLAYAYKNNTTGVGGGFDIVSVNQKGDIYETFYPEADAMLIITQFGAVLNNALHEFSLQRSKECLNGSDGGGA